LSLSFIIILSISFNKWKFDRVLVSFIPFYAASVGLITAFIAKWFIKNKNPVIFSMLAILLLFFISVRGGIYLYDYSLKVKKNLDYSIEKYYGLYSQIQNIKFNNVGVIGDTAAQVFASRYITIAGKNYIGLADNTNSFVNEKGINELISKLIENSIEYFLIPTGKKSKNDKVYQDYLEFYDQLISVGATRYYSWRGLFDIWHFDPVGQSSELIEHLSAAGPRTRIGVYGTVEEVGEEYFYRYKYILQKFNLRIYPLVSKHRTAERNLYYIDRNNVLYLLLPKDEINALKQNKLDAMKQHLMDSKWRKVSSEPSLEMELWMR
jgi:hypothetical protein